MQHRGRHALAGGPHVVARNCCALRRASSLGGGRGIALGVTTDELRDGKSDEERLYLRGDDVPVAGQLLVSVPMVVGNWLFRLLDVTESRGVVKRR